MPCIASAMCLAIPAIVIACDQENNMAIVELSGVQKEVSTVLVDDVHIGDYFLIHAGFALQKLSESEAKSTLSLFEELDAINNEAQQTFT